MKKSMLRYTLYLGMKRAGNLAFSQTGSQFVYACAVDLRTTERKSAEKPSVQTTVRAENFDFEWVFW